MLTRTSVARIAVAAALAALAACGGEGGSGTQEPRSLTIYSGREEELVAPIIERFEEETGIEANVRYGSTAELAAQILEEGENSPADVYWAQDAGALGAVAKADRFARLPSEVLDTVPARFRSPDGVWVGTSGRARVLVYNRENVQRSELPDSVLDLTAPAWRGRIGWAPTNGSFQAFVTALRLVEGEAAAKRWLEGMVANGTKEFDGNAPIVQAVAAGEIDAGLVNHYYVLQLSEADPSIEQKAANHFFPNADVGSLVNVAGVGVIAGAEHGSEAEAFVRFLVSRDASDFFGEEVFEFPLGTGVKVDPRLPKLDTLEHEIDLSDLDDLQGTLALLREAGAL